MATAESLAAPARGVVAVPSTLPAAGFYVIGAMLYRLWRLVKLPASAWLRSQLRQQATWRFSILSVHPHETPQAPQPAVNALHARNIHFPHASADRLAFLYP